MKRVRSIARGWVWLRAVAFSWIVLAGADWAAPSTAAAQTTFCFVDDEDPSPGETYYCAHEEAGLLASLTMVGPNRYSIALRRLEGYECDARAFNDLGDLIQYVGPLTYEDEVVEDCFRRDGECYDISPISLVSLLCYQK